MDAPSQSPEYSRYNMFKYKKYDPVPEHITLLANELRDQGVTFGGKPGENCEEFLAKLYDTAQFTEIKEHEMFAILYNVLDGLPLSWYRSVRPELTSYEQFLQGFRLRFSKVDDAHIWRDIRCRTQGPNEPIIEYVSTMQILFGTLENKISQKEQINIMYRNLNPSQLFYLSDMRGVTTIDDFLKKGLYVEKRKNIMSQLMDEWEEYADKSVPNIPAMSKNNYDKKVNFNNNANKNNK